jgi:hypothetical protein
MERLYAKVITGGEQGLGLGVPRGKRKHALETVERLVVPLRNRLQRDFRISGGAKDASAILQLLPQRAVVVDFAVEDNGVPTVGSAHRLGAGGDVDYAEPPVT